MRIDGHVCLGTAGIEDVRAHLERLELDGLLLHGRSARSLGECREQNERTLELMRGDKRILGLCAVDPAAGDAALLEARRCLDGGMAGAGEFDPLKQGFRLSDPAFLAIADLLLERGALLSLYLEPLVGASEGTTAEVREFMDFIRVRPGQKVLLTRFGGGLPFYELMGEVRASLANVYYDTAPADPAPDARAAAVTASILKNGKLLYGSGAVLGGKEPEGMLLPEAIEGAFPDAAAAGAVLGGNAHALLGRAEKGGF
ncbi:MAG: amidohydrolase family protein [Bacillota bacterium]